MDRERRDDQILKNNYEAISMNQTEHYHPSTVWSPVASYFPRRQQ